MGLPSRQENRAGTTNLGSNLIGWGQLISPSPAATCVLARQERGTVLSSVSPHLVRSMSIFKVAVHWDPEAKVWWATSDDVIGLVAEAATMEAMVDELRSLVPELLNLNSDFHGEIKIRIEADRMEGVAA